MNVTKLQCLLQDFRSLKNNESRLETIVEEKARELEATRKKIEGLVGPIGTALGELGITMPGEPIPQIEVLAALANEAYEKGEADAKERGL
jgi:hypothetical protein